MKYLYALACACITLSSSSQLILNTQFINPCGGDEHNEFIVAKTGTSPVNIADVAFGSYNPSTNITGIGGSPEVDYNYYWKGNNVAANPYPTFSNKPAEACGSGGLSCFGFLYPSIPSPDNVDIATLINELNTIAGCNVFIAVPSSNIIPANSNVIFFLGAGYRSASGLCGFNNAATNLNFTNHCSGGIAVANYYVVFGKGDNAGVNCTTTTSGYFSNSSRRVSMIASLTGGSNTNISNYNTSIQDYTPGTAAGSGNAGLIIPGPKWINNKGCIPLPSLILPITSFINFRGEKIQQSVLLQWTANSSDDVSSFEIQRSNNGYDFFTIGSVAAEQGLKDYNYTDANNADVNTWYRIKMKSPGTPDKFSLIINISYSIHGFSLNKTYPFTATVLLNFEINSSKKLKATASIYNLNGQKIFTQNILLDNGTQTYSIPVNTLQAGNYILKISDYQIVQYGRFIKL